jgi:hypothetical protein
LKSAFDPSLKAAVITDSTVVVAIAAAWVSEGAAMELKLTPLSWQPLPHTAIAADEAAITEDMGNMGAAARS